MVSIRNAEGSIHPLMLLLFFAISIGGLGVLGFLRHWRFLVDIQLRLDKCVGLTARNLSESLNSLASDNRQVRRLRIAIQAARLKPELIPPLQVALNAVVARQEITRLRWKVKQGQWLVSKGCGHPGDTAFPLPTLRFLREPSDLVGPQPLQWSGAVPSEFRIQASHSPRHSAARIKGGNNEPQTHPEALESPLAEFDKSQWRADWSPPQPFVRAGFN